MKIFHLSALLCGLLYVGALLAMTACQPVTSRPELPAATSAVSATVAPAGASAQTSSETSFTTSRFKLPMNFAFGTDWYVSEEYSDLVVVKHKQKGWELAFNLVTTAEVTDPVDPSGKRLPFPEDFVRWIQADPDFVAAAPTAVTVAGYPGVQIDVTPVWTSNTAYKKPFLHLESTGWNLITDPEKWRFIMLDDVEGERVLILQITPPEDFDQATALAQEVMNTMTIAKPQASTAAPASTPGTTAVGAPGGDMAIGDGSSQRKPAGAPQTYSPPTFKVPLSLSAGPDWQVKYNLPVRFAIYNPQADLSFYIVTDAKLADPVDGHLVPFPADFLAWIKADPDFDAVESSSVTVAGIEGMQIDATPIWQSASTDLKLFLSLGGIGWSYRENIVNDPEQWRFILLDDVHGERLLIILLSARGQFDDAVEQAQKVLDTVTFSERAATQ